MGKRWPARGQSTPRGCSRPCRPSPSGRSLPERSPRPTAAVRACGGVHLGQPGRDSQARLSAGRRDKLRSVGLEPRGEALQEGGGPLSRQPCTLGGWGHGGVERQVAVGPAAHRPDNRAGCSGRGRWPETWTRPRRADSGRRLRQVQSFVSSAYVISCLPSLSGSRNATAKPTITTAAANANVSQKGFQGYSSVVASPPATSGKTRLPTYMPAP